MLKYGAELTAAAALSLAALHPLYNNDTYGHMAAGRQIVELGVVPDTDSFSFLHDTPRPWRNHNWLSGLVFYLVYSAAGASALVGFGALVAGATAAFVTATAHAAGGARAAWLCSLLQVVAIPPLRFRLSVRPHLLGLLAASILLYALARLTSAPRQRPRLAWLLLLGCLQAAWLNLHGSSPLGLALTLGYLILHAGVPATRRELSGLLAIQVAASCVSPWGPAILLETLRHVADPGMGQALSEWAPFGAHDSPWYVGALAIQGLWLILVSPSLLRLGPQGRSLLGQAVALLAVALRSSRFIAHALLLGAPAVAVGLAPRLSSLSPRLWRSLALAGAAAAALLAAAGSAALPPHLPLGLGEATISVPAASGHWLSRHHPRARMAGAIEDTWYLSFAVPHSHVLVDGRVAVYGVDTLARVNAAFGSAQAFAAMIDRHRVDAVVLRHAHAGHRQALAAIQRHPDFRLTMLEDRHALFVRRSATGGTPRFAYLPAGYATAAPPPESDVELARLRAVAPARGYVAYYEALATLRPALRGGGRDGLRRARDAAERRRLARSLRLLRSAAERVPDVPVVRIYEAVVAAHDCRLDQARDALSAAQQPGGSREALLVEQEIALREGERERVRRVLSQLAALRGPKPDAWLDALQHELTLPNPCP